MHSRTKVLLAAGAGAAVGAGLVVLVAARRRPLPCPAWAAGFLDNPFSRFTPPPLERLELAPGMRVLDVGSGPGRLSIPAAAAVGPEGEVVALDIQPAMLRKLERRAASRCVLNIRPVLGDIASIPPGDGVFDRAVLVTVLGEIPDRAAALRHIFTALKPGGMLSVTEILPDPHYQNRTTVLRLAQDAGFRLRREYGNRFAFTLNFERPAS